MRKMLNYMLMVTGGLAAVVGGFYAARRAVRAFRGRLTSRQRLNRRTADEAVRDARRRAARARHPHTPPPSTWARGAR
jgi:hypothetical protein